MSKMYTDDEIRIIAKIQALLVSSKCHIEENDNGDLYFVSNNDRHIFIPIVNLVTIKEKDY